MAEERLRIRAEVADNTSGPLRRISRELRTVGAQRVDNLGRSFDHVRSELVESGLSMLRLAAPIGAVATVAGGAFYQAGKKLNEFAKGTLALNDMSKMTGFTITQIEKFSQVWAGWISTDRRLKLAGLRLPAPFLSCGLTLLEI